MRYITGMLLTGAAALLAACGGSGTASSSSPAGPGGPGGPGRRGAAGEVAQVRDGSLILNTAQGDVTVDFTSSTRVQRTSTGTVADIVAGSCIVAAGQRDPSGRITAQTVLIGARVNGSCSLRPGGGGPGGLGGSPGATPRAFGPSGAPGNGNRNRAFIAGEVTAVSGTSVTIQPLDGGSPQTITVPTTVRVARSSPASTSDLREGECVQAGGNRDSSGTVQATNMSIVPPGANGCFSGGGGFGFGRGQGQGPGGGGGGFGGPPPGGG